MEHTLALIEKAHEGDKAARDTLAEENMGLVWSMVRRFANRGVEMEDLCQIGSIGLLKAIDKFDPSFEVCWRGKRMRCGSGWSGRTGVIRRWRR